MNLTIDQAAIIPLITALIELLKEAGIPVKYCPLASLLLGMLAGVFYLNPMNVKAGIITGLVVGLSASGLYSSTKNVSQAVKSQ